MSVTRQRTVRDPKCRGIAHPHDPESIAVTSVSLAEDELEMSLTAPASASGARGHAGPVNGCVD